MLGQVITRAEQELAVATGQTSIPQIAELGSQQPAGQGAVSVRIMPPTHLTIPSDAVIFVLARPAGAEAGMPIAVVREAGGVLPITVTLSDATSMAGQRLSDFTSVSIEVQVSLTGQPGRDNAWSWARRDDVLVGRDEAVNILLAGD